MGRVWEMDLPPNKLLVMLALADHADHDGENIYPSQTTVAEKTGYSARSVRRILRELRDEHHLIEPMEKPGPSGTVRYRILFSTPDNMTGGGGQIDRGGRSPASGGGGHRRPTNRPLTVHEPSLNLCMQEVDESNPPPHPRDLERNGGGYVYPEAFETVWQNYPARRGNNPKKAAYRKWRQLITEGLDPEVLSSAVTAYAEYCSAEGISGGSKVMMARTFFGPDEPWDQDWSSDAEAAKQEAEESREKHWGEEMDW